MSVSPAGTLLSVNVGMPKDVPWQGKTVYTGVFKDPVGGSRRVGKLNVDENPAVSFKFQIRGIPTILIFKGGQVVESMVGLAQKEDLKKAIDKHI